MYLPEANPSSSFATPQRRELTPLHRLIRTVHEASKSATKMQLQQACRRLNLDSNGPKATLLMHLEDHTKKNAAASASDDEEPSAESDTECDAVLATQIEMGGGRNETER